MFRRRNRYALSLPLNEEESITEQFTLFVNSHFSQSRASAMLRRVKEVRSQINRKLDISNATNNAPSDIDNVLDDISDEVQRLYTDLQAMVKDGHEINGKERVRLMHI